MESSIVIDNDNNKKHVEVGIYEETDEDQQKLDTVERDFLRHSLEQLDDQIEYEIKEELEWKNQMYKDFKNPLCPSVIELSEKCVEILDDISNRERDLFRFYTEGKITALLTELFFVLKDLKMQSEMLAEILMCKGEIEEMKEIHEKYKSLGERGIIIESKSQICWKILSSVLNYLLKHLLLDLHKTIEHLFDKKGAAGSDTKNNEIQITTAKIKVVSEYFPLATRFNQSDIFALNEDDPYLEELKRYVRVKVLGPTESVKKSFQKFIRGVHVGVSMLSKGAEVDNVLAKKLTVSFGAIYYYLMSSEAQKQANLFYSKPHEKTAFDTWNILEDEFISQMMKITLPSIKYSNKVYIERIFEPLTLGIVTGAIDANTLNTVAPLNYRLIPQTTPEGVVTLAFKNNKSLKQVSIKDPTKVPILVLSNKNLNLKKFTEIEITQRPTADSATMKTEIVSEKHIEKPMEQPSPTKKKGLSDDAFCGLYGLCRAMGCFDGRNDGPDPFFDGVIVHIHGGGFVSMSASSHQSYTRKWAKKLEKPLLSIDYRLAPEHPYPAALDDCWQAYNWIVNSAEEVLGIKPSKIVLTGDSAGGNLALGVAVLAIKCGIRVPDGLFLAYPALNLDNKSYSPSLMLALDDQLVPYSLLKLCIQSYIPPNANAIKDPLLSPTQLSDEILKRLPPIRMMVGDQDPLHDECWRFTDKLRKLGHDVKLTVYKDMCHGFLGYDVPMGMPEAKVCVQDSAEMIAELLRQPWVNAD